MSSSDYLGSAKQKMTELSHLSVSDEHHDWLALIPTILQRRNLTCTKQTAESARELVNAGRLGNFTKANTNSFLSSQVEETLMESFLEDDYDGALHLTTLDDNSNGHTVGFVFWREIPEEDMKDWIHWDNLANILREEKEREWVQGSEEGTVDSLGPHPEQQKRRMRKSLQLVRGESIHWLEVASEGNRRRSLRISNSSDMAQLKESLSHSWVKLELLVVHPDYWNQRIGTLLMACAMYEAYQKGDDHIVLHVAGGEENVPALRLYEKFGFLPVPRGTAFHKPDRDLFVLGHVGQSLQRLCWPALEV